MPTEAQWLSKSLTHQHLTCPTYNILTWTAQKTQFLCCCLWAAA
jgi:hypothetical protein